MATPTPVRFVCFGRSSEYHTGIFYGTGKNGSMSLSSPDHNLDYLPDIKSNNEKNAF